MKTKWLCLLLLMLGLTPAQAAFKTHTQTRLVLSAETAKPGDTVWAGIELAMDKGWHTYWKYSGDSGAATEVEWELPAGVEAGEIHWPAPEKLIETGLITYGYHGKIMLLVPLKLAPTLAAGTLDLKAALSWLECEKQCVPGKGNVQASLQIGPEAKLSPNADLITQALNKVPPAETPEGLSARWENEGSAEQRPLLIEWKGQKFDFYPYNPEEHKVLGETEALADGSTIRKQVEKTGAAWPAAIAGVVATTGENPRAYEVSFQLSGGTTASAPPANAAAVSATTTPAGAAAAPPVQGKSLLAMLAFAFLGGLILNVMPCVLPVIALKILGFVSQSQDDPGRVRKMGVIYTLGVLVSFLVMAGLVIGVQQAGKAASWGMQFQNPQFLVAITTLVTLVALNLFGVFEINLGGSAMGAAGNLAAKEGPAGAFFNGVLATILATPCTAPFLAVALGFAFAQSPAVIVLMFCAIALGLASPYLILSWKSSWLKFLPRPGAWMEKFKIAMGFPMLATACWLLWLASGHLGESGVLWLGIFLVVIGAAAWVWGEFVQRSSKRPALAMAISAALALASYGYALEHELNWRSPAAASAPASGPEGEFGPIASTSTHGIVWHKWSPERVEAARQAGHPVLVDFTAKWCTTCQANKKASIEIPSVAARLKEINAVAFIADHTKIDPAITLELQKFGRAGVPLVLIFPADPAAEPMVMPEALYLQPSLVLNKLKEAAPEKMAARR